MKLQHSKCSKLGNAWNSFPYILLHLTLCENMLYLKKKKINPLSFSYLSLGHKVKMKIAMLKNAWEFFKSCTMHFIKKCVSILFLFCILPYQFEVLGNKSKLCFSHHIKPSKQNYNMKSHYPFHLMWVHYFPITLLIKVYLKSKFLLWFFLVYLKGMLPNVFFLISYYLNWKAIFFQNGIPLVFILSHDQKEIKIITSLYAL